MGLSLNQENLRLITRPNRAAKKQGYVKSAAEKRRVGGRFLKTSRDGCEG